MRVLSTFPDPRLGGPQLRSLKIARVLKESEIETEFLIPSGTNEFTRRATEGGFEVYQRELPRIRRLSMLAKNLRFLRTFRQTVFKVQTVISDSDADIVHVNTPINFAPAYAAYRSEAALVWHFNDVVTPWPLSAISAYIAKIWADEIVVTAENVNDKYFSGTSNNTKIYPPVDLAEFDGRSSAEEFLHGNDCVNSGGVSITIGAVGNINYLKGYEYLIEAFASVKQEYPTAELIIVGSKLKSQKSYYQKLISQCENHSLTDDVRFLGHRSDVPELLKEFDIFVMPSISETGPMTLLEAMAANCPAVTTRVGVVPELFDTGNEAWTVEPRDSHALADALKDAIDNPEKRLERAANARKIVEEYCSVEACAKKHKKLYECLV